MSHDWNDHHSHAAEPHHGTSTSPPELAGFLAGLADAPRTAVDLGCGTGADAVFLARLGVDVTGVDSSETALDRARERATADGVTVRWLHGDVLQLPLDDASMDLALDRGCLHHVPAADQGRYATEVARVLRPGGTLLVREMNHAGHHAHAVSEESIRAMLVGTSLRLRAVTIYTVNLGDREVRTMLAVVDRLPDAE